MAIKRTSVSITVSRTLQLAQFHPASVSVTEVAEVGDADIAEVKLELYRSATASVDKFLRHEVKKYKEE